MFDRETDTQGYVAIDYSNARYYVVMRGTTSLVDWMDDLEMTMTSVEEWCTGCKVHKGFHMASTRVFGAMFQAVEDHPDFDIVFTGHSLGGALSELLAVQFTVFHSLYAQHFLRGRPRVSVVTFGQPRVGNAAYAAFVSTTVLAHSRVVHNRDIVPHLPLQSFMYEHSCNELFENEQMQLRLCDTVHCPDIHCSEQYSLFETTTHDHHTYLNQTMECTTTTTTIATATTTTTDTIAETTK